MFARVCEIVVEVSVKRERERDVMSVLSTFVVYPIPLLFTGGNNRSDLEYTKDDKE